MTRKEISEQYRAIFRQIVHIPEFTGLPVLKEILADAVGVLSKWEAMPQRSLTDEARRLYAEKGIDTAWDLSNPEDAIRLYQLTRDDESISLAIKQVVLLIVYCNNSIAAGRITKDKVDPIIDTFWYLDDAEKEINKR